METQAKQGTVIDFSLKIQKVEINAVPPLRLLFSVAERNLLCVSHKSPGGIDTMETKTDAVSGNLAGSCLFYGYAAPGHL